MYYYKPSSSPLRGIRRFRDARSPGHARCAALPENARLLIARVFRRGWPRPFLR